MTDPRIAVLSAMSSPNWHPTPEAPGMPWDEAEELLAAYDASRAAPPATDHTTLRERIAEALYDHNHPGWATRYADLDQDQQDTYLRRADAVLAVLLTTTDQAAVDSLRHMATAQPPSPGSTTSHA